MDDKGSIITISVQPYASECARVETFTPLTILITLDIFFSIKAISQMKQNKQIPMMKFLIDFVYFGFIAQRNKKISTVCTLKSFASQ